MSLFEKAYNVEETLSVTFPSLSPTSHGGVFRCIEEQMRDKLVLLAMIGLILLCYRPGDGFRLPKLHGKRHVDPFVISKRRYPCRNYPFLQSEKPACACSRQLTKVGSTAVLTMQRGRSETNIHDLGYEVKMSRRRLANALLVGASVGTSLVCVPLKRDKAAAKAVTASSSVPSLTSAPGVDGTLTVIDSTDKRQRFSAHEKASSGLRVPAVGIRKKRVFLARHGQTNLNKLKICQGRRLNPPLNDEGREQARQLLVDTDLDAIVCSPLRRARETAAIVQASHPGIPITVSDNLNEVDFGGAEGLPQPAAAAVLARSYMSWKAGQMEVRAGLSGESGEDLQQRVTEVTEELLGACSEGGQVLAVSHSSMIKFILATLLDVPLSTIRKMGQDNCAVNALDFDTESGVCEAVVINNRRVSGRADRFDSVA